MDEPSDHLTLHYRGRTVLVTGGAGFVGGRLVGALESAGARVRVLSRVARDAAGHQEIVQGDLCDRDVWDRALPGCDTVFHLAAQTSARSSEGDPRSDFLVNADATWRLLEACRGRSSPPCVVFAGTETQVGKPPRLPLDGTEADSPLSFYDLHKRVAEEFVEFFARRGFVRGTTLRLPAVYGLGSNESAPDCGVLNRMIRAALSGETLRIYGAGDRLRDYLHVEDAVSAFLLAGLAIERCSGDHFVLGSGERHTVAEAVRLIADAVERETGRPVPVTHVDAPADEPEIARHGFLVDATRFRERTGWAPRWPLCEGIAATVTARRRERSS